MFRINLLTLAITFILLFIPNAFGGTIRIIETDFADRQLVGFLTLGKGNHLCRLQGRYR